jgi:hypothetical protein
MMTPEASGSIRGHKIGFQDPRWLVGTPSMAARSGMVLVAWGLAAHGGRS